MTDAQIFERRPERTGLVALRVSPAERAELEKLARLLGLSISDVLRDGLAQVRRQHADVGAQ